MSDTKPQLESTTIRRTMRSLVSDCVDSNTGEVNRTRLAENTAHALNHDEWLDDSDISFGTSLSTSPKRTSGGPRERP